MRENEIPLFDVVCDLNRGIRIKTCEAASNESQLAFKVSTVFRVINQVKVFGGNMFL